RPRSARPRPTGSFRQVLWPCGHVSTERGPQRLRPQERIPGASRTCRRPGARSARLLVDRVALVPAAVLLHLDALAVVHLALDRDVVPPLALLASKRHLHTLLTLGHASQSFCYLMILTTRPEPTVRPPSRIANRKPSSMAMGLPNSTTISVLSPGITISVPSGNATVPVTSVVRK